jgi:hypothetical protein
MSDLARLHVLLPRTTNEALTDLSASLGWSKGDLVRTGLDLLFEQRDRLRPRRPMSGPREDAA